MSFGAQNDSVGIKSAPLEKTQGAAQVDWSLPIHMVKSAAVTPFLVSTGWQKSSVKSGLVGGENVHSGKAEQDGSVTIM